MLRNNILPHYCCYSFIVLLNITKVSVKYQARHSPQLLANMSILTDQFPNTDGVLLFHSLNYLYQAHYLGQSQWIQNQSRHQWEQDRRLNPIRTPVYDRASRTHISTLIHAQEKFSIANPCMCMISESRREIENLEKTQTQNIA